MCEKKFFKSAAKKGLNYTFKNFFLIDDNII